jgi:hypothetical protein
LRSNEAENRNNAEKNEPEIIFGVAKKIRSGLDTFFFETRKMSLNSIEMSIWNKENRCRLTYFLVQDTTTMMTTRQILFARNHCLSFAFF